MPRGKKSKILDLDSQLVARAVQQAERYGEFLLTKIREVEARVLSTAAGVLAPMGRAEAAKIARLASGTKDGGGKKRSPLAGRKKDMSCRVAGCKNDSKGPRFGYMCEEHLKLPKKEQKAAREKWNETHAKA